MEYEIIAYGGLCYNDNWRCRLPHYTQDGIYRVGCKDSYQFENDQDEKAGTNVQSAGTTKGD